MRRDATPAISRISRCGTTLPPAVRTVTLPAGTCSVSLGCLSVKCSVGSVLNRPLTGVAQSILAVMISVASMLTLPTLRSLVTLL
jgi:hypothetical protein